MAEYHKTVSYYKEKAYKKAALLWEKRRILTKIYNNLIFFSRKNGNRKPNTYVLGAAGLGLIILAASLMIYFSFRAYEVNINGEVLAVVRSEKVFLNAVEEVKKELSDRYGQEVVITENVIFNKIRAGSKEITNEDTIIKNIKAFLDIKVLAASIAVDGNNVVTVKDSDTAQKVLNQIKAQYITDKAKYDSIGFKEKVEIREVADYLENIYEKEEAVKLIIRGTKEEKTHRVVQGDNTWVIAKKYNLSVEDIIKANPSINPERLKIDQEISLVVPASYITVQTREYVEAIEVIPFETEYVQTESLYKGDKKITVHGEEGQAAVKGYIVKENGVQVNKDIVEKNIIKEPKTRIIAEGTRARPKTVATGLFMNPTRGRLTSGFGMRWGRRHEGIDIGASIGTPIAAADAGRVSFSGRNGAYGNLVIIDHENGYQTYYAHCDKLLVKKGDRVYKGQKIATVGNTGRSTGPHLHFEVRRKGIPVNPLKFVRY